MMPSGHCRVLILDDDIGYSLHIAVELQRVDPTLLGGAALDITLCNNAYYVAERVMQGGHEWDIILADVFMCQPSHTPRSPTSTAVASVAREIDGYRFTSLEYPYRWNKTSDLAKSDHGGFVVADAILGSRANRSPDDESVLVLMSSLLSGPDRRLLHRYLMESDGCIRYFDKATWDKGIEGSGLLSSRVFKWAIVDEIARRLSRQVKGFTDAPPRLPLVATSSAMQEVQLRAARLAEDRGVKTIFVSGPVGSGKKTIARDIALRRCHQVTGSLNIVPIVGRGLDVEQLRREVDEAGRPSILIVDELCALSPIVQLAVEDLISVEAVELVLLATRQALGHLRKLNQEGLLIDVWLKRAMSDFVVLQPLEMRREDISAIATTVAQAVRAGLTVESSALDWLQKEAGPLTGVN